MTLPKSENLREGCFQTSRSIFRSDIFRNKPDKWFKIWVYLYGVANYKTNSDKDGFRRGEHLMSYKEIMYITGATREQVYRCLTWLKDDMLTMRKTTRGFLYKVNKYDLYQTLRNYETRDDDSKDDGVDNSMTIERRQNDDTISKKDKKDKKEKNNLLSATQTKYPEKFETFWEAYPKKEKKKQSFAIWKRNGYEKNLPQILEFLQEAKLTDRWVGGFIKQPTAFLNGECWDDDLSAYGEISESKLIIKAKRSYAPKL